MMPSDHFVYFYNEVFKYLVKRGPKELDRYYRRVADRQANFTLDAFRREGLKGMYDYWERIRIEENCQMETELSDDHYRLRMAKCPSLTKALESDAGACPVYCDHCPGWVLKVFSMAGYWGVYDVVSRTEPVCEIWAYADRDLARRKYDELVAVRGPDLVRTNLDMPMPYLTNSVADSARFEYLGPNFRTAFEFLRKSDLTKLPTGKVEIDGENVFAYVSEPELKAFGTGKCEVHRAYADIHVPIAGPETIGAFTMTEKELALPFNEKDDYVLFETKTEPLTLNPGEFAVFFPPLGAHNPSCTFEKASRKNKKICVKVRM